ncbi:MAG: hypothetical protein ACLVHS_04565 [Blautia wexlerae]
MILLQVVQKYMEWMNFYQQDNANKKDSRQYFMAFVKGHSQSPFFLFLACTIRSKQILPVRLASSYWKYKKHSAKDIVGQIAESIFSSYTVFNSLYS